jgi:hypothetical protein
MVMAARRAAIDVAVRAAAICRSQRGGSSKCTQAEYSGGFSYDNGIILATSSDTPETASQ